MNELKETQIGGLTSQDDLCNNHLMSNTPTPSDRNPIPANLKVTVTMTARQARALIDADDLTGPITDELKTLSHGVLYLQGALHQAELLADAKDRS